MKRINTEKFLKFLDENIVLEYRAEMDANKKGRYEDALSAKHTRLTYEFIKGAITGEDGTDIGDFVEDDPDEDYLK